jgi:hypothetical protein
MAAESRPLFDLFPSPDGDLLARLKSGLEFAKGNGVLLLIATFDLSESHGHHPFVPSEGNPVDLTEGLELEGIGEFADVCCAEGSITVIPAASAAMPVLLGLDTVGLARGRR